MLGLREPVSSHFMISLASEVLFHIGPLPVTNTLLDTLFVDLVLVALILYVRKNLSLIPGLFQTMFEFAFDALNSLTVSTSESHARKIFPYVMSFFLFIMISNFSGLLPLIPDFGVFQNGKFIPFIRSSSTDLNTTLALALVSLGATHIMSVKTIGFRHYISRFVSLNPLALYTGILELISEFTKIISFSFRLFGNIFVGEVLLASASAFFAYLLPIPLVLYESFVAILQALIFALLTMAFMSIFTTAHNEMEAH
jgi:F-type H+-transporting ATPase subunit a